MYMFMHICMCIYIHMCTRKYIYLNYKGAGSGANLMGRALMGPPGIHRIVLNVMSSIDFQWNCMNIQSVTVLSNLPQGPQGSSRDPRICQDPSHTSRDTGTSQGPPSEPEVHSRRP